jgi:hypothetical protein
VRVLCVVVCLIFCAHSRGWRLFALIGRGSAVWEDIPRRPDDRLNGYSGWLAGSKRCTYALFLLPTISPSIFVRLYHRLASSLSRSAVAVYCCCCPCCRHPSHTGLVRLLTHPDFFGFRRNLGKGLRWRAAWAGKVRSPRSPPAIPARNHRRPLGSLSAFFFLSLTFFHNLILGRAVAWLYLVCFLETVFAATK